MKLDNYYLDLDKMNTLSEKDKEEIHRYYKEMLYANAEGRKEITQSFFNTLNQNGYLKEIRSEKIEQILS